MLLPREYDTLQDFADIEATKNELRALWGKVLDQDDAEYAEDDAFFEVGGDSITALNLSSAAKARGIPLSVEQIFTHATLEDMTLEAVTSQLDSQQDIQKPTGSRPFELLPTTAHVQDQIRAIGKACRVSPDQVENAYPCSPMQESLISLVEGDSNLSLRQLVYEIGHDDTYFDRFQSAWNATSKANPVLRSRICQLDGEVRLCQAVIDEDIHWSQLDMALTVFLRQDALQPMLLGDSFFRYTVLATEEQRYFIWTVHHALCDASSLLEILEEVSRRYCDEPIAPRVPFDHFIESIIKTDPDSEREYWQRKLSGLDVTAFPLSPQPSDFHSNPSSTLEQELNIIPNPPFGLTKALLLRAAWGILLAHHTGTEDIVFGAISNGRSSTTMPEALQFIGPTISLVPVALRVDPKEAVASFLSSVRSQMADLISFEHTGVSKIRSYLAGAGSTATNFQNIFVVHSADFGEAGTSALQRMGLRYMGSLGKTEQHSYPLVTSLTLSTRTSVSLRFQYDERIVSKQHAQNLAHQFQEVLSRLCCASTDTLLESISSFNKHDEDQIRKWNQSMPPTVNRCIHSLFEHQVQRNPNAEAVCSTEHTMTYREVNELSEILAMRLIDLGVNVETPVAVCYEKSIWTVVALLAVFKAGGIYVPIDPAHPQGRIAETIQSVRIDFAISSQTAAGTLEGLCSHIIEFDGSLTSHAKTSPEHIRTEIQPSNTAYLLFTSGSTGKPKGVLISHSAMSTSIMNHGSAFGAGPWWRTLQFAAHTFDISMSEFCTTLAFGGCICVPSEHDRMNDLSGAITALRANVALVVPTVANLITPEQVPTLRTLVLGGEPVTTETISRWADHVNLIVGYGPSETSVYCSANLNVTKTSHPADIGRCIGGAMWIVDPDNHDRLRAIGCVGEIMISGPIVGQGYFNNSTNTSQAFKPTPSWMKSFISDDPYGTVYRTGDLARYNPDGTLRIIGRKDTQVKLRGFRIELGEIENRILESRTVRSCIAALPAKGACARQIVALICLTQTHLENHGDTSDKIVLAEDQAREIQDQIKTHLSLILPEYMVPSIWITLDAMPILLSGKINRRLLKTWIEQMSLESYKGLLVDFEDDKSAEIVPGTTADSIRQSWVEILKVPPQDIGLSTSFFTLGGDSIAAIQVVSRARQVGLPMTTRDILTQNTLGNLAALVDQTKESTPKPVEKAVGHQDTDQASAYAHIVSSRLRDNPRVTIEDSYPFNPIQREILKQRKRNPAVFVLSWKMEFTSMKSAPISLVHLARAWESVVQKHHILRSIFITDPEQNLPPLQLVLQGAQPSVATSSSDAAEDCPTTNDVLPVLDSCFLPHRAHFSRCGNRYFGHIEMDHLVIDGWSFRLIKEDLLAAYNSPNAPLSLPSHAFKSVIDAHHSHREATDKQHWLPILRDQQPSLLSFPMTLTGPKRPPSPTKTIIYLPTLDIAELSAFSSAHSITAASVFEAAWAQTLSLYTGSRDVTFEYVVSGRDQDVEGILEIVGPVMNLLAYHLRDVSTRDDAGDLVDLARRIQEQRLRDGAYTGCNLREVLSDDLGSDLPFNTALNFQRRPLGVQVEGELRVYDLLRESRDPWHFDVLVRILHIMDDNIVRPSIEFDARLFDETKMNEVADVFWRKVQIAVTHDR